MPGKNGSRSLGTPVERPMPEKIDPDPEFVARVLVRTTVKRSARWQYSTMKDVKQYGN